MKNRIYILVAAFSMLLASCSKSSTNNGNDTGKNNNNNNGGNTNPVDTTTTTGVKAVTKTNSQKVYVHYMAWFETPQTSPDGKWGSHWTMANENPNTTLSNGRKQIASWFYPMIGPYASGDRDVIDYHLLLMKYAGIDGVIIDWYGVQSVNDYPLIKRNTDSIFSRVPGVGLQFGICYEDATLAQDKAVANIDTITAAKSDLSYLQSAYFKSNSYIKINSQPLLLCFGPQGMKTPNDWSQAFSGLSPKPCFLPLEYADNAAGASANGEFAWVESTNLGNLQSFYSNRAPSLSTWFAGAYPGFKDFYAQGGWGSNLFNIDYTGTLQSTLSLSQSSNAKYVQLITWNDYGEGTMIEPTLDYNFSSLQTIQTYTGVKYTVTELQLIYKWYTLRKKYAGNASVEAQLTKAYTDLVGLNVSGATGIINGIN